MILLKVIIDRVLSLIVLSFDLARDFDPFCPRLIYRLCDVFSYTYASLLSFAAVVHVYRECVCLSRTQSLILGCVSVDIIDLNSKPTTLFLSKDRDIATQHQAHPIIVHAFFVDNSHILC